MIGLVYVGAISLAIGIPMTILARPVGVGFCRLGKLLSKHSFSDVPDNGTFGVFDERQAPMRMRFLGVVFIIQGAVLLGLRMLLVSTP